MFRGQLIHTNKTKTISYIEYCNRLIIDSIFPQIDHHASTLAASRNTFNGNNEITQRAKNKLRRTREVFE